MQLAEREIPKAEVLPSFSRTPAIALGGVLLVFFMGLLSTLPRFERYHGDERFYTDAAIAMVKTGDYLTPRYAGGAQRLNKPPLSYWILCASYETFGISLFSSRLPFLFAGCGVIFLTWRVGRTLFDAPETALVGAAIMAANLQTMTISSRSTPDILLCLFVTGSILGFSQILLRKDFRASGYALAYLGAGFACATKGFWGVLPVLFAVAFWIVKARREIALRRLAPIGWVFAGAILGLSWFAFAAMKYGFTGLESFLKDQTAASAEPAKWFLISNVAEYAWATIRHFMPWTALGVAAFLAARQTATSFVRANRGKLWFALGWYALVFIIFAFGFVRRTRYLLPTYPCIAVILGAFLCSLAEDQKAALWLRRIMRIVLGVGSAVALATVLVRAQIEWRTAAMLLLGAGGILALVLTWRASAASAIMALSLWIIAIFCLFVSAWLPLFESTPAPALAHELSVPPLEGRPVIALGVAPAVASQVRLISGGNVDPQISYAENLSPAIPVNAVLIVSENWRDKLVAAGYELKACGFMSRRTGFRAILQALRSPSPEKFLNRQTYYIATRHQTA